MNLSRLRTREELAALTALAAADGHGVFRPTHLIRKDGAPGEVCGYVSVSAVPVVLGFWTHTKNVNALESSRVLRDLATSFRFQGHPSFVIRCDADSPFYPVAQRLGFSPLGATHLFEQTL